MNDHMEVEHEIGQGVRPDKTNNHKFHVPEVQQPQRLHLPEKHKLRMSKH